MRTTAVVMLWIPGALWLDRTASPTGQAMLGLLTWGLLLGLLAAESPLVRAQTAVVVVFATVIEYVFSGWLEVYVYRLDHVPAYVPPGHGLVYLAALGVARWPWLRAHARAALVATVVVAGLYAAWGLFLSPRPDQLGAFWYLCLVGFVLVGRAPLLYVGAFVVVTYLELLGTAWHVWAWMPVDTIAGVVSIGNPPSAAAGGYGWFDLVAVTLAPTVVALVSRLRVGGSRQSGRPISDSTALWSSPLVDTPLP